MGGTDLAIATWNVNGLRARAARVASWLDATRPHIVLLQETKCDPDQVPSELFSSRHYRWSARGAGGRNGVLVASRVGLDEERDDLAAFSSPDDPADAAEIPDLLAEPRFLSARCNGIRVASVYAPNGREVGAPHWHAKLRWFRAIIGNVLFGLVSPAVGVIGAVALPRAGYLYGGGIHHLWLQVLQVSRNSRLWS